MDGSNLQRQCALFGFEGARLEPIPRNQRYHRVIALFKDLVGDAATHRELRRVERRSRLERQIARKRNPQRTLELRKNKFSRRVMNEAQNNEIVWTCWEAFRLALALMQRSMEQMRSTPVGSPMRREIMAWVERKDRHHTVPFSFDVCCAAWGLRPALARENLRQLAQVPALTDAGVKNLSFNLARERWKRIETIAATFR